MKKLILLFITIVLFSYCSKDDNNTNRNTTQNDSFHFEYSIIKNKTDLARETFFDVNDITHTNLIQITDNNDINIYTNQYKFGYTYVENNSNYIFKIINNLGIKIKNEIFLVVLYSKSEVENLKHESITYLGLFMLNHDTKLIEHRIINLKDYSLVEDYTSSTNIRILPGYLSLIANKLNPEIKSTIIIYNKDVAYFNLNTDKLNCDFNAKVINNANIGYRGSGCTMNVCKLEISSLNCGFTPDGGLDCGEPFSGGESFPAGTCPKQDVDEEVKKNHILIPNSINYKQDEQSNQAYHFRDNFLVKYEMGRKYINYYYFIGTILRDNRAINKSNILDYIRICLDINELGNKLIDSEYSSAIIITEEKYNNYINFINLVLKPVSKNKEYQRILDEISNDLNKYKLMTRDEIIININ